MAAARTLQAFWQLSAPRWNFSRRIVHRDGSMMGSIDGGSAVFEPVEGKADELLYR